MQAPTQAKLITKAGSLHYRKDIQLLRAYAVILVLLFHAGIGPFGAGFLGVDVFFVISGFLVTRIILVEVDAGNFSFAGFYGRRARRLLPASFVTIFFTLAVAPYVLNTSELDALARQALGAVTFTANYALSHQSGYFDGAANLKPLLHIWSLSLEEQFYLVMPLTLSVSKKYFRNILISALMLMSFVAWLALLQSKPVDAFFMLPTRAWEMLLGAAIVGISERLKSLAYFFSWPATALLLMIPLCPISLTPLLTIGICLATATLIAAPERPIPGFLRPLLIVGDASYSLYLAHWPPIAFLNNAYIGVAPVEYRAAALALGVILGAALYLVVEKPLRYARFTFNRRGLIACIICMCLLASFTVLLREEAKKSSFAEARRANIGLNSACDYTGIFLFNKKCTSGVPPKILIWGDSFAMQVASGIAKTSNVGVIQATKSACAPLLDATRERDGSRYNEAWAKQCLDFNQSVLNYLRSSPSIEVVVISGAFNTFVSDTSWKILRLIDGKLLVSSANSNTLLASIDRTINSIHVLGKKVIVIGPAPSNGKYIANCVERSSRHLITFGIQNCSLSRASSDAWLAPVNAVLEKISAPVIHLDYALCDEIFCPLQFEGVPLYSDAEHLSVAGAEKLATKIALGQMVLTLAR